MLITTRSKNKCYSCMRAKEILFVERAFETRFSENKVREVWFDTSSTGKI